LSRKIPAIPTKTEVRLSSRLTMLAGRVASARNMALWVMV